MWSEESIALLYGDGTAPSSDSVDVLIMDGLGTFGGGFRHGVRSGQGVLLRFADGADVISLGQCEDL